MSTPNAWKDRRGIQAFVKGNPWSTRTAKPGSDPLQRTALAYKGCSVLGPNGSIAQLHTACLEQSTACTALPAGLAWETHADLSQKHRDVYERCYTGNYERAWYKTVSYSFHPTPCSSFHLKTCLSRMWVDLLLFILHQKKEKLSKHCQCVAMAMSSMPQTGTSLPKEIAAGSEPFHQLKRLFS